MMAQRRFDVPIRARVGSHAGNSGTIRYDRRSFPGINT